MCFGVFVLASVYMRYHCNDISYLFNGHFFFSFIFFKVSKFDDTRQFINQESIILSSSS